MRGEGIPSALPPSLLDPFAGRLAKSSKPRPPLGLGFGVSNPGCQKPCTPSFPPEGPFGRLGRRGLDPEPRSLNPDPRSPAPNPRSLARSRPKSSKPGPKSSKPSPESSKPSPNSSKPSPSSSKPGTSQAQILKAQRTSKNWSSKNWRCQFLEAQRAPSPILEAWRPPGPNP